MEIKIVPEDREWIVPILIALFLIEGFILTTKPGLGGFVFIGSIAYFWFFLLTDKKDKQKDIKRRIELRSKKRMCYAY